MNIVATQCINNIDDISTTIRDEPDNYDTCTQYTCSTGYYDLEEVFIEPPKKTPPTEKHRKLLPYSKRRNFKPKNYWLRTRSRC